MFFLILKILKNKKLDIKEEEFSLKIRVSFSNPNE